MSVTISSWSRYLSPPLICVVAVLAAFGAGGDLSAPIHASTANADGGRIIYQALKVGSPNQYDLFAINPDGSGWKHLTDDTILEDFPAASPDGSKVAYLKRLFGVDPELVVMDVDSGVTHHVLDFPESLGYQFRVAWSPDGTQLAFTVHGNGTTHQAIMIVNEDGTGLHSVIEEENGRLSWHWPSWSPDGTQIAFLQHTGSNQLDQDTHVYVVNVDGTGKRQVDTNVCAALCSFGHIDWSPDGSSILVQRYLGTERPASVVPAAGGTFTDLTSPPTRVETPAWSPDGSQIVFVNVPAPAGASTLMLMNDDGSGLHPLDMSAADPAYIEPKHPSWVGSAGVQVEFTQAIQQLQSLSELKSDLEDDGSPPVPIIAGKPAAMRVYMPSSVTAVNRTVEVSGVVSETVPVVLNSGCTLEDRRRQDLGCKSIDFYFTPPEGSWSVTLRVLDETGQLLSENEFNLTSVEADEILLRAISVCDAKDASGNWLCQDPSPVTELASLARRELPTSALSVSVTTEFVRLESADFDDPLVWWGRVLRQLDNLCRVTQAGRQILCYGLTRNTIPGSTSGAAYIGTQSAASRVSETSDGYDRMPTTVAHEVGHALGLDHTNTGAPPLSGGQGCWLGTRDNPPPYPYGDNRLRSGEGTGTLEVGFDVTSGTAIPGDEFYEMMGYCTTPPPLGARDVSRWIGPFSTMHLLSPSGPLSAYPQALPASVRGDFWRVSGTIGAGGQASFDPLFQLTTEADAGPGSGTHRIEVSGPGGVLFTRSFTPAHGHGSPAPGEPMIRTLDGFFEYIPVQPGAELIQFYDSFQTPIGQIELTGAAPVVDSITLPVSLAGVQNLAWSMTDSDSDDHTFSVDYSPDGGETWHQQALDLPDSSLKLDFGILPASNGQGVFRVIASDGVNSAQRISSSFSVAGKAPHAAITGPLGDSFRTTDVVWLEAAAWDLDDGTLNEAAIAWTSSRDGVLGHGGSLPVYALSPGNHTITLTVKDVANNTAIDTVTISVSDAPVVEAGAVLDLDCDGAVDELDALQLMSSLAGIDTDSCVTIGSGDSVPYGDADCDRQVSAADVANLLALVAHVSRGCAS